MLEVRTAGRLGYCFGVSQAIEKAVRFAQENGSLHTLGTLAHNEAVVAHLRAHHVDPIDAEQVTRGMDVAITTHGTLPATYRTLEELECRVLDCTCPIVRKAQRVVSQQLDGYDVVIHGDPCHQEVIGLNGWAGGARFVGTFNSLFTEQQEFRELRLSGRVGVVSQTTRIPADFADFVTTLAHQFLGKVSELRVMNTICPISAARLAQTRRLAAEVNLMLVVGSRESANTSNLAAVARSGVGADSVFIIQSADQVIRTLGAWWMNGDGDRRRCYGTRLDSPEEPFRIGITAGTSTPIEVVNEVVSRVKETAGAG